MIGRQWTNTYASISRAAWLLVPVVALVVIAAPTDALAQQDAIRVLEEEINLLKETIEAQNRSLRKLRERVKILEDGGSQGDKAVADLRRRLARIDVLQTELQALEAKLAEAVAGGATGGNKGAQVGLSVDVRIRPEWTSNRNDLDSDSKDDDAFWGHRARFGGDVGFDSWVRARVIAQEARKFGTTIAQGGELSLHEAWAEIEPPLIQGMRLRVGRTELSYGNERLIGRDDFSFSGRAFDGAVLRLGRMPYFDGQVFYAKVRESGDEGDKDLLGVYLKTEAVPNTTIEAYYIGLFDEFSRDVTIGDEIISQTFKSTIHTIGARAEAVFYGFRVDAEAVVQLGKRTDPLNANQELDHFANAFFIELSYQAPITLRPEIGAFFVMASGDANPQDNKSIDFQPLFPTRHGFLGSMDLFAWSNIMDVGGIVELTMPAGFGFFAAGHWFMLAQKRGKLHGLGGGVTPDGTVTVGRNVGLEVDTALSWSPNDHLQIQGGYSIFLPSTVPEQLQLGTDAAHWVYVQGRVKY
ncbi:MAG: hypothetical protein ACI9WU_005104 [Myxococcota bacterium]